MFNTKPRLRTSDLRPQPSDLGTWVLEGRGLTSDV